MPLKAENFVDLYIELGATHYELIPKLLEIARERHREDFSSEKNFEQSWRAVKGRGLEKVIEYILKQQLQAVGLELVHLGDVGDLLKLDFGEYGQHYPDVDLVVYQQSKHRVLAILSIKTSLRERATQTAYWRNKIKDSDKTRNVKVFLLTPNSDDILRSNRASNKQRAILETDIDATYIVNTSNVSLDDYLYKGKESRIRLISELANDLKELSREG